MALSKIEWTDYTFNPWRGCTKVSDGCKNCYAEATSKRNPAVLGEWGDSGKRVIASESYWQQPYKWNVEAFNSQAKQSLLNVELRLEPSKVHRSRVFCASLADVFEDRPELDAPRKRLFALIQDTPHLDWLLLTKRPENVLPLLNRFMTTAHLVNLDAHIPNLRIGTSIEDQETADLRVPALLKLPVPNFLSIEPLLGPIDFFKVTPIANCPHQDPVDKCCNHPDNLCPECWPGACPQDPRGNVFDWVIVGGESGPHARPMHPDWARAIRNYCDELSIPLFFKQWGEWLPGTQYTPELRERDTDGQLSRFDCLDWSPDGTFCKDGKPGWIAADQFEEMLEPVYRVGKKAAGRTLDGRTHDAFPEVRA